MTNDPANSSDNFEKDNWKPQQDYAWEWFKYHAKQRTDMFNYFLVTTGLLTAGYASLRKDNHEGLSCVVAFLGIFTAFGFYCLDRRNKELIEKSVNILEIIEREKLFTDTAFKGLGLAQRQYDHPPRVTRHTFVFHGMQFWIALMWTGAFLAAFRYEVLPRELYAAWLVFAWIWFGLCSRILYRWLWPMQWWPRNCHIVRKS